MINGLRTYEEIAAEAKEQAPGHAIPATAIEKAELRKKQPAFSVEVLGDGQDTYLRTTPFERSPIESLQEYEERGKAVERANELLYQISLRLGDTNRGAIKPAIAYTDKGDPYVSMKISGDVAQQFDAAYADVVRCSPEFDPDFQANWVKRTGAPASTVPDHYKKPSGGPTI